MWVIEDPAVIYVGECYPPPFKKKNPYFAEYPPLFLNPSGQ